MDLNKIAIAVNGHREGDDMRYNSKDIYNYLVGTFHDLDTSLCSGTGICGCYYIEDNTLRFSASFILQRKIVTLEEFKKLIEKETILSTINVTSQTLNNQTIEFKPNEEFEVIINGTKVTRNTTVVIKKRGVREYKDIPKLEGWAVAPDEIMKVQSINNREDVYLTKKQALSAMAMAKISQLMPYYGGEVTNEEWGTTEVKYCIVRVDNGFYFKVYSDNYAFLAFHTPEQRSAFLENNIDLIRQYLMLDE